MLSVPNTKGLRPNKTKHIFILCNDMSIQCILNKNEHRYIRKTDTDVAEVVHNIICSIGTPHLCNVQIIEAHINKPY